MAGDAGMDTLGCTIVGTITALGGGTVRDLLLGRSPVFWFSSTSYLALCVTTAPMNPPCACSAVCACRVCIVCACVCVVVVVAVVVVCLRDMHLNHSMQAVRLPPPAPPQGSKNCVATVLVDCGLAHDLLHGRAPGASRSSTRVSSVLGRHARTRRLRCWCGVSTRVAHRSSAAVPIATH